MIVLVGRSSDEVIERVAAHLAPRATYAVFDPSGKAGGDRLSIEVTSSGLRGGIVATGVPIDLGDISAIFARPMLDAAADHARAESNLALTLLLDTIDCLVVNRPASSATNAAKPAQYDTFRQCGFEIPSTLVTDDAASARRFLAQFDRGGIVKPLGVPGRVRCAADVLDEQDRTPADARRLTQVQEWIPGRDVRVHVVADRAFGTLVSSSALDYRHPDSDEAPAEMEPIALPTDVTERCIAVARVLDLPFTGIDLRHTGKRWVCFEANPQPAYTYYERGPDRAVTSALVDLLCSATAHPRPPRDRNRA